VATAGALIGDHVPYFAGRFAGTRMLGLYCWVTASVRLFAAACAGCGHMIYPRYLTLDAIGTTVYTSLCVLIGHLIGERALMFLTTDRRRWVFLGLLGIGFVTLIGYRLWRRRRFGRAKLSPVLTLSRLHENI
jgi:membrane protein DedA with SNARE-associated domain